MGAWPQVGFIYSLRLFSNSSRLQRTDFLTYSFLSSQYDCSCKVISAFLESPDPTVQKLVKKELQPLIDNGILKNPKPKEQANQ